jgi:Xaa-Pro dipeptidase
MFVVGKMPALYHAIADVVTRAIDAAIKKVKPGVRCADVDAAARGVIEKAGYGKYFIHGTGHGVGLDVHEYPSVSAKSDAILEEGMVITIEPGIYLPGRFAFREEHMVLVTSCGHDVIDLIE